MTNETQSSVFIPEQNQLFMRLESIFMPFARRQWDKHYKTSGNEAKFVHYTSAEAALSIIKSKRIWMRNATCMSDYSEVQHGFEIINKFLSDEPKRKEFIEALDAHFPGAVQDAITQFNQWWIDIRFSTYITAISEHDNEEEHGRLSMWRAFGSNAARVAIVFKLPWLSEAADALNIIFSPVAYLKEEEVHDVINEIIENVRGSGDFLHSVDRSLVVQTVFNMLVAAVCCLKHVSFREEREWRFIYAPNRRPSPLIEPSTETIGGIPQIVYKLPLDITVSDTLSDLDLSRMFDRLIIGPSPYFWPMLQAFVEELKKAGVTDAEKRVVFSGIPIRS